MTFIYDNSKTPTENVEAALDWWAHLVETVDDFAVRDNLWAEFVISSVPLSNKDFCDAVNL